VLALPADRLEDNRRGDVLDFVDLVFLVAVKISFFGHAPEPLIAPLQEQAGDET